MSKTVNTESVEIKPKRIGVICYLQQAELVGGFAEVMKKKYAMEVHTYDEWNSLYENCISRKVTS